MPERKTSGPSRRPRRRLGQSVTKRPVIDRYADYRTFLRDLLVHLKSKDPGLTYRALAERCGLRSPSFLHLVMNGKRNLGKDLLLLAAVARGLGLSQREAQSFSDLVALNQARDAKQRGRQLKRLVRRRSFREFQSIDGDQLAFMQSWHAVAIHALADAPAFKGDPEWIAERFPGMTKKQASQALELLIRIGFLRRRDDGKFDSLQPHIKTPDEIAGEVVRQYHLQALGLAVNAVNTLPANQQNFGVVTARIPAERLGEAIAHLHQVINDFHDYISGLETPESMMVVQASFQLFPLTAGEK